MEYLQKLHRLNQTLTNKLQSKQNSKIDDVYKKIIELVDMYLKQTMTNEYILDAETLFKKE